ncbi:MAG: hypothetical protein O2894_09845, partial [Planctomycetota bacterium]|nr:hypothetical protein [Planctomycetota bacterium]
MAAPGRQNPPFHCAAALTAALILLVASDASAAEEALAPPRPLTLQAAVLAEAPKLDGRLEEWSAVPATAMAWLGEREQLHPRLREAWAGPEDASVRVRAAVFGDDLYLALAFEDDVILHNAERAWWHGDSLELFIDPARADGRPAAERFGPDCRQIFLMPANAELPWGVVYRGRRQVFDGGGLVGLEVVRGPDRPGGLDAEVRIPLANFGVDHRGATQLGFALALNDTDDPQVSPESYLSWNRGFDLYLHPDHFGVLEIPAREPRARPTSDSGSGLAWWWFALLAVVGVAILGGPAARWLAGIGPRAKLLALGVVLLLAGGVALQAHLAQLDAEAGTQRMLDGLAAEALAVVGDAAPFLEPPADSSALSRSAGAADAADTPYPTLLQGGRIAARAGVEDAAPVALHPEGAWRAGPVPAYALPLSQPHTLYLPEEDGTWGFELELDVGGAFRRQVGPRATLLGRVTLHARDGAEEEHTLGLQPGEDRDTRRVVTLRPQRVHAWRRISFEPEEGAPAATLRALRALRLAAGPPA